MANNITKVNPDVTVDVAVVGAGIGGLSAALQLHQSGKKVLLLEKASQPGGVISSKRQDGYLLEHGPNTAQLTEDLGSLIESVSLGERLQLKSKDAVHRFIGREKNGKLVLEAFPRSIFSAVTSPLLSSSEKLRALAEPFVKKSANTDEDSYHFIARRFGAGVSEKIFSAGLNGIYACKANELSCRSALPKLWQLEQEYGSVLLGALKSKLSGKHQPRGSIFSFPNGMTELCIAIWDAIPSESKRASTEVTEISLASDVATITTSSGDSITAEKVILTTEADVTAKLIEKIAPELAAKIAAIPYAPLGILHLGVKTAAVKHPLNGFGALIPPHLGKGLLGILFSSTIFSDRAPAEHSLLTCFCGGAHWPELAKVEETPMQKKIREQVCELLDIDDTPEILSAKYWPRAIPNFPLGHHDLVSEIEQFHLEHPSLELFANWIGGVSVGNRLKRH